MRNAYLSFWEFRPQALRWRAPSLLAGSESWLNQTPTTSGLGRWVDSKRGHFNHLQLKRIPVILKHNQHG
jgi:hypothetical protein